MKLKLPLLAATAALIATAGVTPAFAAVTATQAESTVLAKYGGKLDAPTEMEDQDGTQVFGVHVAAADGKMYDVKVDANSGTILSADPDDGGPDAAGGGPEGAEGGN